MKRAIGLVLALLGLVILVVVAALWPLLTWKAEPPLPPGPDDFVIQFGEAAERAANRTGNAMVGGVTEATQDKLKEIVGDPEEQLREIDKKIQDIKRRKEEAQQENAQGDDQ